MGISIKCEGSQSLSLGELSEFQGDLKTLTIENYKKLKKEILELGFCEPLTVWKMGDKNFLLNGHQRFRTLRRMFEEGIEVPPIPVNFVHPKDEAEASRIVLSLTSQFGIIEKDGLYEYMTKYGISMKEVEESFRFPEIKIPQFKIEFFEDKESLDSNVPKKREMSVVNKGDIWKLGRHSILCGDSTDLENYQRLLGSLKVDLTFTSPPYNADSHMSNTNNDGPLYREYSDDLDSEKYIQFAETVLSHSLQVTDGFVFWNVNYNSNSRSEFIQQLIHFLPLLEETICWKKTGLPVPGGLTRTWEPIFVFKTTQKQKRLCSNTTEFNYWDINNAGANHEEHRACFPIALPEKAMRLLPEAKTIFDPFLGSGTTLIAAERQGRQCYGIELDPVYCQVVLERFKDYAKIEPVREDGVSLSQLLS